jgi:hypothetical protein
MFTRNFPIVYEQPARERNKTLPVAHLSQLSKFDQKHEKRGKQLTFRRTLTRISGSLTSFFRASSSRLFRSASSSSCFFLFASSSSFFLSACRLNNQWPTISPNMKIIRSQPFAKSCLRCRLLPFLLFFPPLLLLHPLPLLLGPFLRLLAFPCLVQPTCTSEVMDPTKGENARHQHGRVPINTQCGCACIFHMITL